MKNRISPRHPTYDYTSPGGYFVTICTQDREHYFGNIVDGVMIHNDIGECCENEIRNIETKRKNVEIHEYIVMPNHIHMILVLGIWNADDNIWYVRRDALAGRPDEYKSIRTGREPVPTDIVNHDHYGWPTLWQIINTFKWNVKKYTNKNNILFARQSRYHDHIIRDHKSYERIKYYIQNNPKNWNDDRFF